MKHWKMKNEKFLLDIHTKCSNITKEILNVVIDAEWTFKCKRPYLTLKNMKIHFTTSYVPNSKFKLYDTPKFWRTYKLKYMHCFFWAKTDKYNWRRILAVYHLVFFFLIIHIMNKIHNKIHKTPMEYTLIVKPSAVFCIKINLSNLLSQTKSINSQMIINFQLLMKKIFLIIFCFLTTKTFQRSQLLKFK